jgi:tetratricopeptide (TPR) repeat protein
MLPEEDDESLGAVVISAVDGAAGIGKTALAVRWAHRVQHRFPDGTLHANLRGYGPGEPATPADVLDSFLRALGTPSERMGLEALVGLYRSLLAGRRVLIVLDNASSADQVRPLLPAAPGCMVLVTSRDSLTGLVVTDGALRLTLDLLTEPEAQQLLSGIIGSGRVAAEPDAVRDMIRLCARLPLALRIAAGRVTANPHATVADIVTELADDHNRLDVLSHGDDEKMALRVVFDWSYERLAPKQAYLFRRLGLHPGPDISFEAAVAVSEQEPYEVRRLLETLTAAHLIEPTAAGRYRFHDLLHTYAADLAHRHDCADDRDRALQSFFAWYAHTAWVCDELLFPAFYRLPLGDAEPVEPSRITDGEQALNWLTLEQENILAALHDALDHRWFDHVMRLAASARFLFLQGSWEKLLEANSLGLVAAQSKRDTAAEAMFHTHRSENLLSMGQWAEAEKAANQALFLACDIDDRIQQAYALNSLGLMQAKQGRFDVALTFLRDAMELTSDSDTSRLDAIMEGNMAQAYAGLGRHDEALTHGTHSLSLRRRVGDRGGEPYALNIVAQARQGMGEHQTAIELCREAIAIGRESRAHSGVAESLATMAVSLHHVGDVNAAIASAHEAAMVFDNFGRPNRATQLRAYIAEIKRNDDESKR